MANHFFKTVSEAMTFVIENKLTPSLAATETILKEKAVIKIKDETIFVDEFGLLEEPIYTMEAILNKYEVDSKEEFFDGIITAAQINANEFAKEMIEELSSELKQEFKAHFEHYIANDIDAVHEGETYQSFIDSIYIPNPNN